MFIAILLSLFAGIAIFLGGILASLDVFKDQWHKTEARHFITAVGAGALLAAICFVLIPDGISKQSSIGSLLSFLFGGICFMGLDILLSKSKTQISQLLATLSDFLPEAIVLGVILKSGDLKKAIFLTVLIAMQNLPEGYASFIEMTKNNHTDKNKTNLKFFMIGLSGPMFAVLGYTLFAQHSVALGTMMTFCAGGILYIIFEDVAPQIKLKKHWLPAFGTIVGFLIGMAGHVYTS